MREERKSLSGKFEERRRSMSHTSVWRVLLFKGNEREDYNNHDSKRSFLEGAGELKSDKRLDL